MSVIFVDDLVRVHVLDAARSVGGKRKLLAYPYVQVRLGEPGLDFTVHLEHRNCWRGGKQSYFRCPTCGRAAFILFFDPARGQLRCRSDWRELRYRSQERGHRRGELIANATAT